MTYLILSISAAALIAIWAVISRIRRHNRERLIPCPECDALYELTTDEITKPVIFLVCPQCGTEFKYIARWTN